MAIFLRYYFSLLLLQVNQVDGYLSSLLFLINAILLLLQVNRVDGYLSSLLFLITAILLLLQVNQVDGYLSSLLFLITAVPGEPGGWLSFFIIISH